MTPAKWQKVKEILGGALALDESARASFVAGRCDNDETLFNEVSELLRSHTESDSLYEVPFVKPIIPLEDTVFPSRIGQTIGPYKILSEIGRGGMGTVYLASRADDEFRRKVAIKLIKRGIDTDEVVRRFKHERQILAGLSHPNISALYDGGTTENGLPYLVMEFIEGEPLNEYANSRELDIKSRLEIFLQICSAVSYAHRSLVIHRDLKPSNILVTADGTPKLLDFGIAKLTELDNDGVSAEQTIDAFRALTPEYASPEQVRGNPVTTASDIFSLGVILFEFLTGHRPFKFESRLPDDVYRVLDTTEPTRPSSACRGEDVPIKRADALAKMLRGDLDNVILMALRKEPDRRYSSVEQFAEDIRRFLDDKPVIAQEDTFGYRASKFVRRHKFGIAAVSAILISLIGGLLGVYWQSRIAADQRDAALAAARKADQVNAFLNRMLASADPMNQGKNVTITEFLAVAADQIDRDFANEPEIIADLRTTIGLTYLNQGKYDLAKPQLDSALKIRSELLGPGHADTARSLHNVGLLLKATGNMEGAEAAFRNSIETLRGIYGTDSVEITDGLHELAYINALKGNYSDAIALLRQALENCKQKLGPDSPQTIKSMMELGAALTASGDNASAEPMNREALTLARRHYGDEHLQTGKAIENLFATLQKTAPVEAEELGQEMLRIRIKLFGTRHPDVGWVYYHLSYLRLNNGDPAQAEAYIRKPLEMRGKELPDEHVLVGSSLLLFGRSLMEQRKLVDAEAALREALTLRQKALGPDHWLSVATSAYLGECLYLRGDKKEGSRLLQASFEKLRAKLGDNHAQTNTVRERMNRILDR